MDNEILAMLENLINMTNAMMKGHPTDLRFNFLLLSLKEIKSEISEPNLTTKAKLRQLGYDVTRVYSDMLDYEKTPLGEELVKFLLKFNDFYDTLNN
ncbi:MAG: hypothetical protein ABSA51_10370 [Anaerolineaceae bacterium]